MRAAIVPVLAVMCACQGAGPEEGRRYVSIGVDALATARTVVAQHGASLEVLEVGADAAVIAIDEGDLEALSEQMHERHDRCGGFMLHDSLDDARASLRPPPAAADRGDYTLDQ